MRLPENAPVRRQVSTIKANQIKNSGADYVTTPCVVCMLTLDDTCQTYNLGKNTEGTRAATMLFEVLYEAMYKALEQRGELDRMRTPIGLQNCSAAYFQEHSAAGKVTQLMQQEEAASVLAWLEADAVVQRFFAEHPEGVAQLATFKALHARAQEGEVLELCERIVGSEVVGA
jgi:Tfp pilus assembly pilus retraction ATPase PilT